MVTWPANISVGVRELAARRLALRERLRWCPPRSARRKKLEAELAELVREELQREAVAAPATPSARYWWDRQ